MALSGRAVRVSRNGDTIIGARTDTVTINNEPLDITDKDDLGWRTMLGDAGVRSVSCEVEGVIKSDVLVGEATGASSLLLGPCSVDIAGLSGLTGEFHLQSLQLGAEQADVVTFTATLESSGGIVRLSAPICTVAPVLSVTDGVASVTNGTWTGIMPMTFTYIFQTGTNPYDYAIVQNSGSNTYTIAPADSGLNLIVSVFASNADGGTAAQSNVIGPLP